MTFKTSKIEYRIMLDTQSNQFMAVDAHDNTKIAFGNTIEKAILSLNHSK